MFSLFFDNIFGLKNMVLSQCVIYKDLQKICLYALNIEIVVRQFALHLTKELDVCIDQTPSLKAGINQNWYLVNSRYQRQGVFVTSSYTQSINFINGQGYKNYAHQFKM